MPYISPEVVEQARQIDLLTICKAVSRRSLSAFPAIIIPPAPTIA